MIVSCPSCQTRYRHDAAAIFAATEARCSRCEHCFPLQPPRRTYVLLPVAGATSADDTGASEFGSDPRFEDRPAIAAMDSMDTPAGRPAEDPGFAEVAAAGEPEPAAAFGEPPAFEEAPSYEQAPSFDEAPGFGDMSATGGADTFEDTASLEDTASEAASFDAAPAAAEFDRPPVFEDRPPMPEFEDRSAVEPEPVFEEPIHYQGASEETLAAEDVSLESATAEPEEPVPAEAPAPEAPEPVRRSGGGLGAVLAFVAGAAGAGGGYALTLVEGLPSILTLPGGNVLPLTEPIWIGAGATLGLLVGWLSIRRMGRKR